MDLVGVTRRRVLFVCGEEVAHTSSDGMIGIDDLGAKALQRPVPNIAASDQIQVRSVVGIKAHRVVQIKKAATVLDESNHSRLLFQGHPAQALASRENEPVAQDDEQLDAAQIFRREST